MVCIFWLLIFGVSVWSLAYFRVSLVLSTLSMGVLLLGMTLFSSPPSWLVFILWFSFLGVLVPLNLPAVRRPLASDKLLRLFKKTLPTLSQTEKDALEAGTVWWDGDLFSGAPDWKKMLDIPKPQLSEEEQTFIDGPVNELCQMLDDWQITEELHDLPDNVWQFIKDNGFFGMIIPKKYGGLAFSALAHSTVVMKISSRSTSAAVTVMVPNSLGPAELLLQYGTDEQKDHYLPRLACGKEIPCFALTGPTAGSDAGSIPDEGVVCYQQFEGKETLGIRLNWEKRYITLGPVATVLGLAFRLYDPECLIGSEKDIGITLALIPTGTEGVSIGRRHFPLNLSFQNGPNSGKDVFIPMDWVIGGQEKVGNGWRMLMECLAAGRAISLPALSTGGGKLASRATGAYARIRTQFKMPIGRFEGVEEALTRIAANTYSMDAVRTMTAGAVDLGAKPAVISAVAKYNLTEKMRQSINDAMDIQGGSGICMGTRNLIGRVYQAIPISITVEGANILTRTMITFGQGAIRCHPYVLSEIAAVQEKDQHRSSLDFDRAILGHIGFVISNLSKSIFLGLSGARLVHAPGHHRVKKYYQQLSRMSAVFALLSDMAMLVLGGSLKRKEKLSGRFADVLSQLYIASAVLKRFYDQDSPVEDLPLVEHCCEDCLFEIQNSFYEILQNFPNKPIALLLRWVIFPLGRRHKKPGDALGHRVANILLSPSECRDRLTTGIYISNNDDDAIGRLENTFALVNKAESIEKKLKVAVRNGVLKKGTETSVIEEALLREVISNGEAELMNLVSEARTQVITVDDFPQNYWAEK